MTPEDLVEIERIKQLKARLRTRNIGRLEVKKRGVDVSPEKLAKRLAGGGKESATLLLTPVGNSVKAILARRRFNL